MGENELRGRLAAAGKRRADAVADRDAASQELAPLIREAVDRGIPLAEIARISSLSRQGAYELLRRASQGE